ncbi:MAG: hypothetical protein DRI69_01875 [Bacteroidetes bacterium]|nr:MAG: hypothetical protein DRI69_01875 [Bacteroidota bacterium]
MGDLMPGIPSIPGDETTWTSFVDQFETLKKGDIPLSLTNWDSSTTVPAIAAGSAIEVAGAVFRYPSEEASSLPSDSPGVRYFVITDTGTAYFSGAAPEWSDELNGWYNISTGARYTGHVMDWDGDVAYTNKRVFTVSAPGGDSFTVNPSGDIAGVNGTFTGDVSGENITAQEVLTSRRMSLSGIPTARTVSLDNGESVVLPVGSYYLSGPYQEQKGGPSSGHDFAYELRVAGAWFYACIVSSLSNNAGTYVLSDGLNNRITKIGGAGVITFNYIEFV